MERNSRRGMDTVLSSLILCTVVLVIGASVWSVTQSASLIMASDYFTETMKSVENVKERFIIENIEYKNSTSSMKIWIYNYGNVKINITLIRVTCYGITNYIEPKTLVSPGQIITMQFNNLISLKGKDISIVVTSERGNKAYATVHIPATTIVQ